MAKSSRVSFIGIDVHSCFCVGGWTDSDGRVRGRFQVPTTVPALTAALQKVPGVRKLVIEEGPMSDWLVRSLQEHVDEMVSCDPWRNALVSKGGEKSDAIDWQKLADLYRGGFVRAVHHSQELSRSLFKQHVQLYHDRVRHRVSEALKIIWQVRRAGVVIGEKDFQSKDQREALLERLPADEVLREDLRLMFRGYDIAAEQVILMRRELAQLARKEPVIGRLRELPGVGLVRAATIFAFVDTPFRFKTKQKLWKYMGIGLEKRQSGSGRPVLRVPQRCNKVLKSVIIGAAKSAAASKDNPFAEQYQTWREAGCSPRIARRNLARSLAAVLWGLWKSGGEYDSEKVGPKLQRV